MLHYQPVVANRHPSSSQEFGAEVDERMSSVEERVAKTSSSDRRRKKKKKSCFNCFCACIREQGPHGESYNDQSWSGDQGRHDHSSQWRPIPSPSHPERMNSDSRCSQSWPNAHVTQSHHSIPPQRSNIRVEQHRQKSSGSSTFDPSFSYSGDYGRSVDQKRYAAGSRNKEIFGDPPYQGRPTTKEGYRGEPTRGARGPEDHSSRLYRHGEESRIVQSPHQKHYNGTSSQTSPVESPTINTRPIRDERRSEIEEKPIIRQKGAGERPHTSQYTSRNTSYIPKGQSLMDEASVAPNRRTYDFEKNPASRLYSDISAVRPSNYAAQEVSDGFDPDRRTRRPEKEPGRPPVSWPAYMQHDFEHFPLRSRVRFVKNELFVGATIQWTGFKAKDYMVQLAVLRLDQPLTEAGNGIFANQQLVRQVENNRYVLCDVQKFYRLPKLTDGDYCYVVKGPNQNTRRSGFLRNWSPMSYELHPVDTDYRDKPLNNISRFPDFMLEKTAPPVTDEISDNVGPITRQDFPTFLGRNKGIQGKKNSCYLDTLLFSVFAFTDDLDEFLFDEKNSSLVANNLRYSIIFPLRACQFVADVQVEYLRRGLAQMTGNESFETETRDIPECLEALFGKALKIPPPLHVGSDNFFTPTFSLETLTPGHISVPTCQDFLDFSSVLMSFSFREIPKYFFLQLPRQAHHASIVIPSLYLDLNNILHRSVKECSSCQRNATLQLSELYEANGLAGTFLCRSCAEKRGLNTKAARQLPEPFVPDGEEPDSQLALSAVLCIERSHYNCFARCEDRWVFFDSMSDQEELLDPWRGVNVTFNIPVVREVPNFVGIIEDASKSLAKLGTLDTYLAGLPEEHLVRLFKCAYIAIYTQSRDY